MPKDERRPFRIIRGQYARREGDLKPIKDPETGQKIKGFRVPEYVHYAAATADNPGARDEVMLTDAEAHALGWGRPGSRVIPLFRHSGGNGEGQPVDPRAPLDMTLEELIRHGDTVSGTKSLNTFRQMVFRSGFIKTRQPLPTKKHDLLHMLRKVHTERANAEARDEGENAPHAGAN